MLPFMFNLACMHTLSEEQYAPFHVQLSMHAPFHHPRQPRVRKAKKLARSCISKYTLFCIISLPPHFIQTYTLPYIVVKIIWYTVWLNYNNITSHFVSRSSISLACVLYFLTLMSTGLEQIR